MTQPPVDPRAAIAQPGDVWVSVGKPLAQVGAVKVRLTPQYLFFEKGMLRTDSQQVPLVYVTDVDASQSMQQKMRGVGNITVHVHRNNGMQEVVSLEDLPDFRQGVQAINDLSRQARLNEQRMANTQHMNYQGMPPQFPQQQFQQPAPPPPPQPQRPSSDEVFAQLEKLGEMKDKGWVTEEEFQSKKTELLGRL